MQYTIILSGSVKHSVSCIKLLLTEGDVHEEVDPRVKEMRVKKTTGDGQRSHGDGPREVTARRRAEERGRRGS